MIPWVRRTDKGLNAWAVQMPLGTAIIVERDDHDVTLDMWDTEHKSLGGTPKKFDTVAEAKTYAEQFIDHRPSVWGILGCVLED